MPRNLELQRQLAPMLGSVEDLLDQVDQTADPALRATVQQLMELVMTLHGAGLERILELVHSTGESGDDLIALLGRDELVANLLVLHGLHPLSIEARVARAVETSGERLHPYGAQVELLSIQDGVVRLRLDVNGCASSAATLKEMVEQSMHQAAPDLTELIVEGGNEKSGFVSLKTLLDHPLAESAGKAGS